MKAKGILEDIYLEELDLSVRSFFSLKKAGVNYIRDLMTFQSEEDLKKVSNLGVKNKTEIAVKMREWGLRGSIWDTFLESAPAPN